MSRLHLCAEGLRFAYAEGDFRLEVERVELAAGEAVACVGASGSGKTTVIRPGDTYEHVATNELEDGCMASPAVVGDALILRTRSALYRIEEGR